MIEPASLREPGGKVAKKNRSSERNKSKKPTESPKSPRPAADNSQLQPLELGDHSFGSPISAVRSGSPSPLGSPNRTQNAFRQRNRPDPNAKAKAKKNSAEEIQSLRNVWAQMVRLTSKGSNELQAKDFAKILKNGGAQVDKDTFSEFIKEEIGSSATEADFLESAQRFFNDCSPLEECADVWNLIGAGQTDITGEGSLQAGDLCAALNKFGFTLTMAEAEDIVAYSSNGNDEMNYTDFVRALFPETATKADAKYF